MAAAAASSDAGQNCCPPADTSSWEILCVRHSKVVGPRFDDALVRHIAAAMTGAPACNRAQNSKNIIKNKCLLIWRRVWPARNHFRRGPRYKSATSGTPLGVCETRTSAETQGIILMNKFIISALAVAALSIGPALGADLPVRPIVKAPPLMPPPVFSWTGCYLGAGGGYGMWNQDAYQHTQRCSGQ